MERDPNLHLLSWGHHHGLATARRMKLKVPSAERPLLNGFVENVYKFWSEELLPHFRAEEECLLPRLLRYIDISNSVILRTLKEHMDLHRWIIESKETSSPDKIRAALIKFSEKLTSHIRFEERVMLNKVQDLLSKEELSIVGKELEGRLKVDDKKFE
ncbi:MAG: hemerythrin domain-containing protein [Fidelibacterota bacterium]